jgi:predicted CXXCH cytochrome family protein
MNILGKLAIIIVLVMLPAASFGVVSGHCSNCHTMHNSQGGNSQAMLGTGIGWSGDDGQLSGGSVMATPQDTLLVTTCVGCHSSSSTDTIIDLGGAEGSRIPIVYNTTGYPSNALAAGNFYSVAQGNDSHGHNVYGIAGEDAALSAAPGGNSSACNTNSCHGSLAKAPDLTQITGNFGKGGCQGCHVFTSHHDKNDPTYRFLEGHNAGDNWVIGDEDDDWEYTKTGNSHNFYQGESTPVGTDTLSDNHSISAFCGGCHIKFHREDQIKEDSAWIRHPVDIALPTTGAFAAYNPVSAYDADVPVAWTDSTNEGDRGTAVVMCLSCHRAHGSQYPDMLRWDYSTTCNSGVADEDCGCFKCHSDKD